MISTGKTVPLEQFCRSALAQGASFLSAKVELEGGLVVLTLRPLTGGQRLVFRVVDGQLTPIPQQE